MEAQHVGKVENFNLPILTCPHCGQEHDYNWDNFKGWVSITDCRKCKKEFFFEIDRKPFFSAREICKQHEWGEVKDIDLDEQGNPNEDSHGAVWVRQCKICGVFADQDFYLQLGPKNKDHLEVLPQVVLHDFFNHPLFWRLKDLFEHYMSMHDFNDHKVRDKIATHFYNAIRVLQGEDYDAVYQETQENQKISGHNNAICENNMGAEGLLTIGKPYYVYQRHVRSLQITDDTGAMNNFHASRFKKKEKETA